MAVPIIQSIVGVVLVLLGIDASKNPPTSPRMLWLYRGVFAFLGVLLLSLAWIQYRNEQLKDAAALEHIQALTVHQLENKPAGKKEVISANTQSVNQIDYQQKYATLLTELAANKSLDPNFREQMIIARAKIGKDTGTEPAASIPAPAPVMAVTAPPPVAEPAPDPVPEPVAPKPQTPRDRVLALFDYGVKTLGVLCDEEAGRHADKAVLNYQGLPQTMAADPKTGKRFRKNVGQVTFANNPAWEIKVEFVEMTRPKYEANLSVTCAGGFLLLRSVGEYVTTHVETVKGQSFEHQSAIGDVARSNITDAVGKLIAAEVDATAPKK